MFRPSGPLLIFLLFCLFGLGCKSEDPNPELKDPIYKDLLARRTEAEKTLEEAKKSLEELLKSLSKAEPNSIELKDIRKDIAKTQLSIQSNQQRALYYKIRSDRRKIVAKNAYREAFANDRPWPDRSEYSAYLTNLHLREVNLNWSSRVPKLQDRTAASVKAAQNKPKGGEKASGGAQEAKH